MEELLTSQGHGLSGEISKVKVTTAKKKSPLGAMPAQLARLLARLLSPCHPGHEDGTQYLEYVS